MSGFLFLMVAAVWIASVLAIAVRAWLGFDGDSYDARRRNRK